MLFEVCNKSYTHLLPHAYDELQTGWRAPAGGEVETVDVRQGSERSRSEETTLFKDLHHYDNNTARPSDEYVWV